MQQNFKTKNKQIEKKMEMKQENSEDIEKRCRLLRKQLIKGKMEEIEKQMSPHKKEKE